MKSKAVLLGWRVLPLFAGAILILAGCNSQDAELAAQREKELETVRAELEQAKANAAALESDVTRLRKDNQDLLRLRNEVGRLREEKQQLTKQVQTAQSEVQNVQAQAQTAQAAAQSAQAQAAEQAEAGKQRSAPLSRQTRFAAHAWAMVEASGGPATPLGQAAAACINNLRQIDGAKQQWALEYNMPTNALPTWQDLARYLRDGILPTCPASGTYTPNAVGVDPNCSVHEPAQPP